ncbi:TIGR03086 family protein [Iamia sp. SCSIO 61187]|uniref:TIGR03086 family metal-binding protein n=1 Tax=Iamia sp. SCSIO 61187 TaxID=2722752 RepID=UPI001C636857|nr:TIGR03086 family metal-binding protein [Iamia sp. SCSIO 61187]QYG93070.1 TIGR03086 family protein [Iamia sp. SCSIO 61187]
MDDARPSPETLVPAAAATFTAIVEGIGDDQLDAATPCADYDVAALVGHLLHWGPSLVGAGRKEVVPPPEGDEVPAEGSWRAGLEAHVAALTAAWSAPGAWEGTTRMGGPMEMPAATVGGIVLAELVVHGWDLARATGQQPSWPDPLLEVAHAELSAMAEVGRRMGAFGPEVAVAEDAPVLDRLLGVAGRDPAWTP